MHRQLSLEYYRTENGYLVEYTGSGTTPTTRHYGFAEWEDTVKKLIEILSETIGEKVVRQKEVTINFPQPVFFDREETMEKFVDVIMNGINKRMRQGLGGKIDKVDKS